MEKRARERAVKERRERKEEKRRAKKLAASADADTAHGQADDAEPEGAGP